MPILLTKPFSVGDLDPDAGEGYKFAQLTALYHNGLTFGITLEWQFGTASGDYYEVWQRGAGSPTKSVDVPGAQVVPLWGQMPKDGESVGQAIRRVTYQYLIDNGFVAGTIVNNPPLPPAAEPASSSSETPAATPAAEPKGDDTPAAQPAASEPPAAADDSSAPAASGSDSASEPEQDAPAASSSNTASSDS